MIRNATILRIDTPTAADAGGNRSWTAGPATSCRCLIGEPTQNDRYSLSALEEQGTLVMRVKMDDVGQAAALFGSASAIAVEQRLSIQDDRCGATYYRVRQLVTQPHGSMSMYVAALKKD